MTQGCQFVVALTLCLASVAAANAHASAPWSGLLSESRAASGVPTDAARVEQCLRRAALHFEVSPLLLRAIAQVESSGNPRALNEANRNGSRDIGLMQINSSWLPTLARWDIHETDLFDPCISAHVGAWILADNLARLGPVWRAVGAYNARSPERQWRYVQRVQQQLARLQEPASAGRRVAIAEHRSAGALQTTSRPPPASAASP